MQKFYSLVLAGLLFSGTNALAALPSQKFIGRGGEHCTSGEKGIGPLKSMSLANVITQQGILRHVNWETIYGVRQIVLIK